ncbi:MULTISPECIES: hypothetical protein [Vibrio]|uniref:hypothetical protein n=1 Tax=Vibrio TaxID=662 RepID=UPI001A8E906D|nr:MULTISPECIES: hypothetical protein [Vibrio]ELI0636890.1 hypothetical protein [Vibrio harveyi]EGR0722885.1 hypothetical protein [Vibrio alginolyticus]EIO9265576.1 hypothetical protein [Vibrio alginolyticus]ELB2948386.1 hypothetical protein [Vibrio alginolyticus]MBO0206019.1 hypothetical protein [Vibrio alginolyticus]
MKSDKTFTISKFIALKNSDLSNAQYYDERLDRFMEALEGVSHWENGEYDLSDLEKAWNDTASKIPYDDHGMQSV